MQNILGTVRRAAVFAGLVFSTACSTDITAPQQGPRTIQPTANAAVDLAGVIEAVKAYFNTTVLARHSELAVSITVSKTIGSRGGTISIHEVGFELEVPRGAVSKDMQFTVTALAGKAVAYEFGPHGTTFKKALIFRQDARYTTGWWNATHGGYFKSTTQVDSKKNEAKVDEVVPMTWDGFWMTIQIKHFSGYLVSCA